MKASVPGGAHMIKFFEGMCKMLPAVVSGRKGNIRNVQSTVAQKKGGLLDVYKRQGWDLTRFMRRTGK